MVSVQPPDPYGGGISLGPDPLLGLLRLLRMEPKGVVAALLTPLGSSSLLWSVSVPGFKIPLIFSLPPDSLPARLSQQSFSGMLFEENKQLFFRGDREVDTSPPLLLLLGDVPDRSKAHEERMTPDKIHENASFPGPDGRLFAPQTSAQKISDPYFSRTGDVPNPLFQKVDGPVPPGLLFPGGAPPSVMFEICWPDQRDSPSPKQSGVVSPASFSFRLSMTYATGETMELAGVYDPSSSKISLYPRTSSHSLLSYWKAIGGELGTALEKNFSIFLESHRRDHG